MSNFWKAYYINNNNHNILRTYITNELLILTEQTVVQHLKQGFLVADLVLALLNEVVDVRYGLLH